MQREYRFQLFSLTKWDYNDYAYGSQGWDGAQIYKTNSKGSIPYRVGVLWEGSDTFYHNLINGKLKADRSVAYTAPGHETYYKMRLRYSKNRGATGDAHFFKF